ncbi:hypothetical protein BCR44DRAFT_34000 [Catenaria anguillulae PL171]|uniref:Band 7 domain-containing protein n=1 Tax=Catenaria anguillulae PL171 TaxID=765915 RepID=A0A1Y2HYH8_9FUNG|nr:hypothetical protein BCR44DRAFT_34000 [Catenaria anguillulae PL171]
MSTTSMSGNTKAPQAPARQPTHAMILDTKTGQVMPATDMDGTDDWSVPESVKQHPFFVETRDGSIVEALRILNDRLISAGMKNLITRKPTRLFFGNTVQAGQIGLYEHNGRPVVAVKPGKYLNMSLVHSWEGRHNITDQLDFLGLTFGQVGQGETLVVQAPNNQVFCIRNGGFCALGYEGRFKIIDVVDTLNLGDECAVREHSTRQLLGWRKEVKAIVQTTNGASVRVTVATFFNVPANNVLIVQQGDRLLELPAGQHVITNPTTTFRGFFSLAERQKTFKTKPAYTVEGVPVILNVNLRYRLAEPLLLARHYDEPFMALENPAQSAVNAVVSRLSYQQFMRAKNVAGADVPDVDYTSWIETFKDECMRELTRQAETYGICVESFNVLDRELEGDLGKDLQKQADLVLQNQIRATQISLENAIKLEAEKGRLRVAEVEAEQKRTRTDADYYASVKGAAAKTEASAMQAKQDAENIRLLADAKAKEIELISQAYRGVQDSAALHIMLAELEIKKTQALPPNTVYFSGAAGAGSSSGFDQAYMSGYGSALGVGLAQSSDTARSLPVPPAKVL